MIELCDIIITYMHIIHLLNKSQTKSSIDHLNKDQCCANIDHLKYFPKLKRLIKIKRH